MQTKKGLAREFIVNRRSKKRKTFDDIVKPLDTIQNDLYNLAAEKEGELVRLDKEKKQIEVQMGEAKAEAGRAKTVIGNIGKFFSEKIMTEKPDLPKDVDMEETLMLKPKPVEEPPIILDDEVDK